jgi:hypothetical protein
MKVHKFCDLFPEMENDQFIELITDIEKNGLVTPIWRYGNTIIDGKHRFRACQKLGITPLFRDWQPKSKANPEIEAELLAFVVSQNLTRRHLSTSQRAVLASKLHKELGVPVKDASTALNVSERTVKTANALDAKQAAVVASGKSTVYGETSRKCKFAPTQTAHPAKSNPRLDAIMHCISLCDSVLGSLVPKSQEAAIEIGKIIKDCPEFSKGKVSASAKNIFEQFEYARRLLRNMQSKETKK